jgi:hypothetical protein
MSQGEGLELKPQHCKKKSPWIELSVGYVEVKCLPFIKYLIVRGSVLTVIHKPHSVRDV